MTDVPVQLVVAAFQDESGANEALKELKHAKRQGLIKIDNAAVLRKDEKGKLHIKETHDMGGGKGAAFGGVAGAAIGLLAGPALVVPIAVGALVGGLTAKLVDSGFSNKQLETLGDGLTPGSSAIVAVVEHRWVAQVEEAMAAAQADLITAQIQADIAQQLEADHDVAYSAITSDQGLTVSRLAVGEADLEGETLTIDDTGTYGGRFVATPAGFAVEQLAITDDEIVDAVVVGVLEEDQEAEPEGETEAAAAGATEDAAEGETEDETEDAG